jgi:hypothetical protein
MEEQASQWVSLSVFPTTYKLWITRQMLEAFKGQAWIEGEVQATRAQAQETRKLEDVWKDSRKIREGRSVESTLVDPQVDRFVTALCGIAENVARVMPADSPEGAAARLVLKTYFPEGSAAITRQAMLAQLEDVEGLVEGLSGTHAAEAALVGLTPLVGKLVALLPEYAESLGKTSKRDVSYGQLLAARAADQERLALLIARLLVRRADHPADATPINAALAAVRVAAEKLSERRAANRGANLEVNPDTGEPVVEA